MTNMTRDQYLIGRTTAHIALSVCQVPVFERRVDADFVVAVRERQHLAMGQAESPVFLIVRRAVRDPVRSIGKRKQVRLEFAQWHGRVHRRTVIQDVQVALPKVHDPLPIRTLDIGIANIPLFRYGPVEHRGTSWDLNDLQLNTVLDQGQCPPDAVTRDVPTNRVSSAVKRCNSRPISVRSVCSSSLSRCMPLTPSSDMC